MSTLVLTSRRIESRQSGYDLRVANLCAYLPGAVHLVVAPLQQGDAARPGLRTDALFASVEELPPVTAGPMSARRHLRLSEDHFLEKTYPAPFVAARDRLRAIVAARGVTDVVVFGVDVAELAATLTGIPILLDVCDSTSLTTRRALESSAHPLHGRARLKEQLALRRRTATDTRLASRFARVTTISDPDSRAVEGRRHPVGTVTTLPNGVDESFLRPLAEASSRRGVVFWGNLAFAPNREALWFFVHDVFLPTLGPAGVEFCVVGGAAPDWLVELAAREPAIVLTGYVEDLRTVVTRYPVMVNPMRTGSGLKNKVLEAFGLGLGVVSTPLGVEAVPQVEDGTHALCADDADAFAAAVLALLDDPDRLARIRAAAFSLVRESYRWDVIGRAWVALLGRAPATGGSASDAGVAGDGVRGDDPAAVHDQRGR